MDREYKRKFRLQEITKAQKLKKIGFPVDPRFDPVRIYENHHKLHILSQICLFRFFSFCTGKCKKNLNDFAKICIKLMCHFMSPLMTI